MNLSTLLNNFANFSGLQINRVKLVFVGFSLTNEEGLQSLETLGTPIESLPMRYLGPPLKKGRMSIIEKVEKRLEGW